MKPHKVKQGEDLITIAKSHKINDWEAIYNHSANERLKKYRPDPMSLQPGDVVYIPDTQPIIYKLATNQKHQIQIEIPKTNISLQLKDSTGTILSGIRYQIYTGKDPIDGTTDGGGMIKHKVSGRLQTVKLHYWPYPDFPDDFVECELSIGTLDASNEISGIQGRLNNMGIPIGKTDGEYGPLTHGAINYLGKKSETKKLNAENFSTYIEDIEKNNAR